MKRNSILSIAAVYLLMSLVSLAASDTPKGSAGAGAAHPELVVSTQWLADHLNDPNLVIVHIAHDEGDYRAAHIPGARYLAMDKFATDQMTKPGTELLPPDQLKKNLEEIGIGDDTRVVYYAPDWDPMATRLFFTMDYL
jgi:thiosulfate/3-mercaptopyruvate sulfurtransferase